MGAVIVKAGKVIGTGVHWASGFPHAEIAALNDLTPDQTASATLFVTLEPCCHWGKTPPCTDRIIQHRFAKVVYGLRDPNPAVSGQGCRVLLEAGIACEQLELPEITDFYQSYCFWWQHHRPRVVAKLAMSLDGKIALSGGKPIAITGAALTAFTHRQRRLADAILTTVKTIQNDDPQLNVRLATSPDGQSSSIKNEVVSKPIYILDTHCRMSLTARIWDTASRITLLHGAEIPSSEKTALQALQDRGAQTVAIPQNAHGRLNLTAVLEAIGSDGIHELWVEAGGQCFSSLIQDKLVQRAHIYLAPMTLGADAVPGLGRNTDVFVGAKDYNWQIVGRDAVCTIDY